MTHGLTKDEFRGAISKQSKLDQVVATIVAEASLLVTPPRKSLVFCHFRREMIRIRDMLIRSFDSTGDDIAIIDGTVSPRERSRIFATQPTVLILQIRTCSEGLNLQSYSDVYFVSPHWNPCVEDQAIARCYRIGQTSQVRVFRFYMSDFVAEKEDETLKKKSHLDEEHEEQRDGEQRDGEQHLGVYISTLDHTCEEIQKRKRALCNDFLCDV